MTTTSINFHLRPSARAGRHRGRLFIRIIRARQSKHISTDYSLYGDEWDARAREIVFPADASGDPDCRYRLSLIRDSVIRDMNRLHGIVSQLSQRGDYSAGDVACRFTASLNRTMVHGYAEITANRLRESGRERTARAYRSAARSLTGIKSVEKNDGLIARITKDMEAFKSRVEHDGDGKPLNPVRLDGVEGGDPKFIGKHLNHVADTARTHGAHDPIGTLYGFELLVKTETTNKDDFDFVQNRFFVRGEGDILYHYNNGQMASDPETASRNFINALQTMPQRLLDKYQAENKGLSADIPALREVVDEQWRKEDELKVLKDELAVLDGKIRLSLKSVDQIEEEEHREQRGKQVANGYGTSANVAENYGFSTSSSVPEHALGAVPAYQRHDPAGGQTSGPHAAERPDGQGVSLPPELQRIREAIRGKGLVARPLHGAPEKKGFKI